MKSYLDICYGNTNEQILDVHLPDCDRFPVFVYFHGGGLKKGSKGTPETLMHKYLADHGVAVVSANYRMYPNAKYPDFIEDAAQTVAWALKNMPTYGEVTGFYVGGTSAGSYLTQMLCFDETWYAKVGVKPTDIAGYIHAAGQPTCHFNVLQERGIDPRRVIVDEAAPLYHIAADKTYPPMLVIISDNDKQNRYEQTMLLISTMKHFGYEELVQLQMMQGKHCAYVAAADENGDSVFGKLICKFIFGEK